LHRFVLIETSPERRRRLTHRAVPLIGGLAALSLVAGLLIGSAADSASERTAKQFGRAWERGDLTAMYSLLSGDARSRYNRAAFDRAYRDAAASATIERLEVGSLKGQDGDRLRLPVTLRTRIFGRVRGDLLLPVPDGKIDWAPYLSFPAVKQGEVLHRRSIPPLRAALLSRQGKVLASGPADARRSPLAAATQVTGRLEPQKEAAAREAVYARGFARDWPVGQNGLERAFERELAGRPGGELLAGTRALARAAPHRARAVRTTIDAKLQEAAALALGGRFGGIAALDARTGEVRALAGIAFSAPQPPGSTFKIVTTTAALEAKVVKPATAFPVQTKAVIDGVDLENANGEACGGTFRDSFANSCNSVFAPLGVKVGAKRLVSAAERYGFNARAAVPGEVPSSIPHADDITSPLDVGSTAIGQGRVLATPLRLASIAQTVSAGGVRMEPSIRKSRGPSMPIRVTSRRVASTLTDLMLGVVGYGTGTAAAIPGVKVAGKTGTAELEDTRGPNAKDEGLGASTDPANTDAWFAGFAPADRPRIAAAAMFVKAGAGGATAAPAVRAVLAAALGK
jgi:peptidoglycan glycosyltransferase